MIKAKEIAEQKEKKQDAQQDAQTVAAWQFLGSKTDQLWLLVRTVRTVCTVRTDMIIINFYSCFLPVFATFMLAFSCFFPVSCLFFACFFPDFVLFFSVFPRIE